MQTLEEFKSSLPADLTPEQRTEKIEDYAKSIEDQYRNLQSKTDKDKSFHEELLEETKKIWENPNYVLELYKSKPEMAEMIVKKFWNGITIEDLKAWKVLNMWSQNEDLFDKRIKEHERKKELTQTQDKFTKNINLSDDERKTFDEQLSKLVWGREITSQELQQLMIAVAFTLGKNISTKEWIMLNQVPPVRWAWWWDSWGTYQPKTSWTQEWLKEHGVLKEAPKK